MQQSDLISQRQAWAGTPDTTARGDASPAWAINRPNGFLLSPTTGEKFGMPRDDSTPLPPSVHYASANDGDTETPIGTVADGYWFPDVDTNR